MAEANYPTISYEQLDAVRQDVDRLSPGYAIQELDPSHALDTGQGNCFTSSMIAGCVVALEFGLDASVAWSSRLHATERPEGLRRTAIEGKTTDLNIAHIELLVPRGEDDYDVLALGYGLDVKSGEAYTKQDKGGQITNYNFLTDPEDRSLGNSKTRQAEALVRVGSGGDIVPTQEGKSLGLMACDWQQGGTEYLAALNIPPIDYEALEAKVSCFLQAMRDGQQIMHISPVSD
jgi:hypothetical protein